MCLLDDAGFALTLMKALENPHYPAFSQISFLGAGAAAADALYRRPLVYGFEEHPPGHYRKGEFYFATPFGFTVQVS